MEITSGYRTIDSQLRGYQLSQGRQRKAFRTDKPNRYAFLNEKIEEIACSNFNSKSLGLGNIDWGRNLPYLEASARKWCELHGEVYNVEPKIEKPFETVNRIFQFLISKTHEERFDIDYVPNERMIKFLEYQECDFPDHQVFYFPLRFMNNYPKGIREILMAFASWIYHKTIFILPSDCFDFEMIFESYEYESEYEDDEEIEARKKAVDMYRRGKAAELFWELEALRIVDHFIIYNLIDRLNFSERQKYRQLIDLIDQGLKIMINDDLRNHTYFPGYSTDNRFSNTFERSEIVFPDRLFVFTYGDGESEGEEEGEEDEVVSAAIHCLSEEVNNSEIFMFRDAKHISPDDTEPFVASEFPMEWAKWFNEFLTIYGNEQIK